MLGSPIPPQSRLVLSRSAFHRPPSSQRLQHLLNVLSQVFLGPPLSSSTYKVCYQLDIHPFRIVGSRDWESPVFHPVSGGRWRRRLALHAHSVLQTLEVPHPRAPSPNLQCLHTSPNLSCPEPNMTSQSGTPLPPLCGLHSGPRSPHSQGLGISFLKGFSPLIPGLQPSSWVEKPKGW